MTSQVSSINITRNGALIVGLLCMGAGLSTARAELRCDCSQIVGSCSADINLSGDGIRVKSSTTACSRIDYLIDGQPFTALVVDGSGRFDWNGQPQSAPQIVVESCELCADNTGRNAAKNAGSSADSSLYSNLDAGDDDPTRALVKIMPAYPRSALGRGIEGTVTVAFDITTDGIVENIRVIDISDIAFADSTIDVLAMEALEASSQAFVDATVDAVSRFRYRPEASGTAKEQFSYRILNNTTPSVTSARL